jgi:hypothetical protein
MPRIGKMPVHFRAWDGLRTRELSAERIGPKERVVAGLGKVSLGRCQETRERPPGVTQRPEWATVGIVGGYGSVPSASAMAARMVASGSASHSIWVHACGSSASRADSNAASASLQAVSSFGAAAMICN